MKIRFDRVLTNLDGAQLKDADGKTVTLGKVCANALLNAPQGASDSVKAYMLATVVYSAEEIDLPVEDIARMKESLSQAYNPLISGQGALMLEGTI